MLNAGDQTMIESGSKETVENFRPIRVVEGKYPHLVYADIIAAGDDIQIIVGGGEKPHIGAIAFSEPEVVIHPVTGSIIEPDFQNYKCIVSTISAKGHKETEVAKTFAEAFCMEFNVVVSVSAGIHLDNASEQDIKAFLDNIKILLDKSIVAWKKNGS